MKPFTASLTQKPQAECTSCDAYFMVVMDTGMKAQFLVHKYVSHKCESDQWSEMSWMWKLSGNCRGHTKGLLCTMKLGKSPWHLEFIFSEPRSESSPTVGKNEVWGHLLQGMKSRVPRTFTLYIQQPPKGAAFDLQTWVQPLALPHPPRGDFNCKVTKSSP